MGKVIAIDPGNTFTGWIILDDGKISPGMFGKTLNAEFLAILKGELCKEEKPRVVCEFPFPRGMLASIELFLTVRFIGELKSLVERAGVELEYANRADVKLCVCGSSNAKDGNVRQSLLDMFGPQGTKKQPGPTYGISKDVWAALAVGVTYLEQGDAMPRYMARRVEIKVEKAEKKARKKAKEAAKVGV